MIVRKLSEPEESAASSASALTAASSSGALPGGSPSSCAAKRATLVVSMSLAAGPAEATPTENCSESTEETFAVALT